MAVQQAFRYCRSEHQVELLQLLLTSHKEESVNFTVRRFNGKPRVTDEGILDARAGVGN